LGISHGVLFGLLLTVGSVAFVLADIPPKIDGETLMLAVELRWPPNAPSPATIPGEPTLELGSITRMSHTQRASSTGPLWTSDAKLVDGHWVVPGAVDIFTTRGRLSLVARIDSTKSFGFLIPLWGRPHRKDMQWTDWLPKYAPGAQRMPDGIEYRYRVQKRSEPVRTETIGPFEVQTIAWYFYNESMETGKVVLATNGRFAVRHGGQTITVDAKQAESEASEPKLERADGVAVIGGRSQPGLLVHFVDNSSQGPCYVLTDQGGQLETTYIPHCSAAAGSVLTTDSAAFRDGDRKTPRGRIDYITFEKPGLYSVGYSVLDSRRLTTYTYEFPEGFSPFPAVSPLGISPDERSFVRFGSVYSGDNRTSVAVMNFVDNKSYSLPVDEARMRYPALESIDPAWLMHHFEWHKGSGGADSLVERKSFVPLPYHTRPVAGSGYWLEPAQQPLRDAVIDFIVAEFKGEKVPVAEYAYEYPVKIGTDTINVAYGETGNYVAISLPTGGTNKALLETIVHRLDAALATGKYDDMFGRK
jgi:hypothetical protein